jgi:hypothetical protein
MAALGAFAPQPFLSHTHGSSSAFMHRTDECPIDSQTVTIDSAVLSVEEEGFQFCADLMTSGCSFRSLGGLHAFTKLATLRDPIRFLTPEITAAFADLIIASPNSDLFKLLKRLTNPNVLEEIDVPILFQSIFDALLDYFNGVKQKYEDKSGWFSNITATKNAVRTLSNLIIAHPPFYNSVVETGTDVAIFDLIEYLDSSHTDEEMQASTESSLSDTERELRHNQNNYSLATVAGMLAFYQAVIEFIVPDSIVSIFETCLNWGSQYLTHYTLKIIEAITRGMPELCCHFYTANFLDRFFSLGAVDRLRIDLWYVSRLDQFYADQKRISPATLRAKRRYLYHGYHALGILANFCRLHDPAITTALIGRGILDYDLVMHSSDTDLARQFFIICKHILLTPECSHECLVHPSMQMILTEWANWTLDCRTKLNVAMAFLITNTVDPAVEQWFRDPLFLDFFIATVALVSTDTRRSLLIRALLKLVTDGRQGIAAFIAERREELEEGTTAEGEARDLMAMLLQSIPELPCE